MKKMVEAALLSAEMHPDRVGERITAMRKALHKSPAQLADSLEYDRSSMTKVEKGTKGLDIVVGAKIAEMYGFGLDWIYRGVLTDVPEDLRAEVLAQLHAARAEKIEKRRDAARRQSGVAMG